MSEDSRDSVKTEAVCDARERLRISEIPAGMASAMRKVPTLQRMISGVHQACLVTTLGRGRTQMKGIREHKISSYGSLFFFLRIAFDFWLCAEWPHVPVIQTSKNTWQNVEGVE